MKAAFEPGAGPIMLIDGDAMAGLLMENNIDVAPGATLRHDPPAPTSPSSARRWLGGWVAG